jgi:septum formation protein
MNLILASGSPRRKQLMQELGFTFSVEPVNMDESLPAVLPARKAALFLAQKKGAIAKKRTEKNVWILSADSVVIHEETVLTKPANRKEAMRTILSLSNQVHQVHTAFSISYKEMIWSERIVSTVFMDEISRSEAEYYIDHYQPFDKAGSYAIQEWIGHCKVSKIEGSYTNIVGLPTREVYRAFKKMGYFNHT